MSMEDLAFPKGECCPPPFERTMQLSAGAEVTLGGECPKITIDYPWLVEEIKKRAGFCPIEIEGALKQLDQEQQPKQVDACERLKKVLEDNAKSFTLNKCAPTPGNNLRMLHHIISLLEKIEERICPKE